MIRFLSHFCFFKWDCFLSCLKQVLLYMENKASPDHLVSCRHHALTLHLLWVSLNSHTSLVHQNSVFMWHRLTLYANAWQETEDCTLHLSPLLMCAPRCPHGLHLQNINSNVKLLRIFRMISGPKTSFDVFWSGALLNRAPSITAQLHVASSYHVR